MMVIMMMPVNMMTMTKTVDLPQIRRLEPLIVPIWHYVYLVDDDT